MVQSIITVIHKIIKYLPDNNIVSQSHSFVRKNVLTYHYYKATIRFRINT